MKDKKKTESYVIIMGQTFPRSELIKLFSIVLFIILMFVVGGTVYYLDWRKAQFQRIANQEDVEAFEAEVALEKVNLNPLKAFFKTYLSQTNFDKVDSIRAAGIYKADGAEMDLTFLAKQPGLYRQTLRKGALRVEFGYDGETVWLNQSHEMIDSSNSQLLSLNKSLATLESAIPCLAWEYDPQTPNTGIELMPDSNFREHECYVIKNTRLLEGVTVYHYIDKETSFEHYRQASVEISSKRHKDVELFYDPPLPDSKYPIPSGMQLHLDGKLYYHAEFKTVDVNMGLVSFLFKAPEDSL